VKPLLIVNPASAAGRTGRQFDAIGAAIRSALGDFEAHFTSAVGDGATVARQAAGAGRRLVVAVGGDGTASEVVDGLLAGGYRNEFGFIPRGTGGDLRRTLNIPHDVGDAARALAHAPARSIDLGRVEFTGNDGAPAVRHFANVASCGITGVAAGFVNRSSKVLGGKLSFKIAAVRSLLGWRDRRVRWRADGGPWVEASVTALSVCNARFFGGGMMVAPAALVDDGLLDVTIWSGFGMLDFVLQQPKIYDGRHVQLSKTRTLRARTVEVEPLEREPVILEVDGEQPGRLPARFTVLPGALTLRGSGLQVG
jgi:YegS/Rv2252/BmrU family lipid kinase